MKNVVFKDTKGNVISLPSFSQLFPPVPMWKSFDELAVLAKQASVWNHPKLVYLASADQWLGMEPFLKNNDIMECDVFYTVIGGMAGLNFISRIKQLKKIIFYDSNSYALRILDLQIQLILNSSNINEYISLIYQRPFDMLRYDYKNQIDFLRLPINTLYYNKLKDILSPEALETYNYYYAPYIKSFPLHLLNGPTMHCTWLLPCHGRVYDINTVPEKTNDSLVCPMLSWGDHSNTFYVGKGWLENDESFLNTKQRLFDTEIEAIFGDVTSMPAESGKRGLYMSNICSTDIAYMNCAVITSKFDWAIGYDDFTNWEVQYYPATKQKKASYIKLEGMFDYELLIGAGNSNTHATCCVAIDRLLDLNSIPFLEVIAPPLGEVEWGFRFYKEQKTILASSFLSVNCFSDVIVLHILLAAGVDQKTWREICKKAVIESKRFVLIFEHRKECTDWPEDDVCYDNLLDHKKMDQFIYSLDSRWRKFGIANLKGSCKDVRNILYFLDKKPQ